MITVNSKPWSKQQEATPIYFPRTNGNSQTQINLWWTMITCVWNLFVTLRNTNTSLIPTHFPFPGLYVFCLFVWVFFFFFFFILLLSLLAVLLWLGLFQLGWIIIHFYAMATLWILFWIVWWYHIVHSLICLPIHFLVCAS